MASKYVDAKGNPIKPNNILSIYIKGKKRGEVLVKTLNRKKVIYRIHPEDNHLSENCCYLDEALEKASKVILLKKTYSGPKTH